MSEIDAIIDNIVDMANRYIPELSNAIDSLKALEKERSFLPDVLALKDKYEKTLLYLNQIIEYIEKNGLTTTNQNQSGEQKKYPFGMSEGWAIFWATTLVALIILLLTIL